MGNPAALLADPRRHNTSTFTDEIRAYAVSLFARCMSTRRAEREIKERFGYGPDHDTLNDWRNQADAQGILVQQAQEVGHRATEILWDALSDIARKPDKAKYVIPLNAVAGTMRDKLRDSANVNVNLNVDLQVNQVVASMGEAELERFIARGQP